MISLKCYLLFFRSFGFILFAAFLVAGEVAQAQEEVSPTIPVRKVEGSPWTYAGKMNFGSNFSYGPQRDLDFLFKEQASLKYNIHKFETTGEYYTYYWGGDEEYPFRWYKNEKKFSFKYLNKFSAPYSVFVSYGYDGKGNYKSSGDIFTDYHNFDTGFRWDLSTEDGYYALFELGPRFTIRNVTNKDRENFYKLRAYAAVYYSANRTDFGLWSVLSSPFEDLSDYKLEFGPNFNYNFEKSSFFVGFSASAELTPEPTYDGDTRFKVWSGSFYGGFKL